MSNFPVVTNFASVEVPKFLEKKNQNIVYFGVDNLYPFELIDLYNDSSTHNAIINGKVGYIVGNGLESEDLETKKWLSSANISEDWTSLLKRIALDYELFNGYAIEVIRTSAGNQYHHIDFANLRLGLDGGLQYADDWITDKGTRNSKPDIKHLERYNPKDLEQKRGVIYHIDYRPNLKYYPLPVYVGSLAEIKTDVQIGDYWLQEVKSGFAGGTIITHNNGVPETQEEAIAFEKSFQDKFGGASGTKIVHLFSPSKDNSSEITSLNGNDLHERYVEMSNRVKESIFIGHRVTNPILFGVKEAGQLGGRSELDLAYEIFANTYVQERKNTILRTIKKLAFFDIQNTNIELVPLKPIDTIDLTSDIILANLTRLEIRDLINAQTGLKLVEEVAAVITPTAPSAMCSHFADDNLSAIFNKYGVPANDYEIVERFDIDFNNDGQPIEFATEVQDLQRRILAILQENPLATASVIAEMLEIGVEELVATLEILQGAELIVLDNAAINLSPIGKKVAKAIEIPKATIKYVYEERPNAPPLKAGGKSRDFCEGLMASNRYWSREEIELLRNDMKSSGYADVADVWLARGGWYRPEGSDTSLPYCRHIWTQVITRPKQ
jgi:hypothetical protein